MLYPMNIQHTMEAFASPQVITTLLAKAGYISDPRISMAIYLAQQLRKPVLVEGPAGVGKTDLAQSLANSLNWPLLRLQCYEGLDESKALYEWKYGKQLLYTQILKEKLHDILGEADSVDASIAKLGSFNDLFFSRDFLEPRPLLQAMEQDAGSVLLIDEVDKSDEEFEAFLLEILSEFQVTVPELGTIRAQTPPLVLLTSNNSRDLSDALKRRCLHLYIGFPDAAREQQIVRARVPDISQTLLTQLVAFVQLLRGQEIKKSPSISETVDWARTLLLLHANVLEGELVRDTLNVLLKHESDIETVTRAVPTLVRDSLKKPRPGVAT